MRGLWLGLLGSLVAVGCDDGVVIEVRTPGATDEVELFLGIEECSDCPGVNPTGGVGAEPLPGRVFFRDDSGDARRYTQRASGGVARFHIKPSDRGSQLQTVAAVARGSQLSATLVHDIDLDADPQHYVLDLAPAMESLPPPVPPDGIYVAVWDQPATTLASACFAFERWHDQRFVGRAFIVPKDDPDCDGFTSEAGNECNPYVANGSSEPEINAETACLIAGEQGGLPTCRLGGSSCTDGTPNQTQACAPSSYCVPNAACSTCDVQDPVHTCLPLIREVTPRLVCRLPVRLSQEGTHYEACTNVQSFVTDLGAKLGLGCVDDSEPFLPLSPAITPAFTAELKFPSTVPNADPLYLKMRRDNDCQYRVDWGGDVGPQAEGRTAYVRFVVEPVGRPTVRLLMPILLELAKEAPCESATPSCAFEPAIGPDLFACLEAP